MKQVLTCRHAVIFILMDGVQSALQILTCKLNYWYMKLRFESSFQFGCLGLTPFFSSHCPRLCMLGWHGILQRCLRCKSEEFCVSDLVMWWTWLYSGPEISCNRLQSSCGSKKDKVVKAAGWISKVGPVHFVVNIHLFF